VEGVSWSILSAFQYVASLAFPDPLSPWGFRISFILQTLLVMRNEQSIIGGREDATSIYEAMAGMDDGVVGSFQLPRDLFVLPVC